MSATPGSSLLSALCFGTVVPYIPPSPAWYYISMSTLTTVKVSTQTQRKLRDRARHEGVSQSALIEQMLRDREEADFWAGMAGAPVPTPEELDEVDAAFIATARDGDL